jgi:hypothetical protein
MNIEPPRWVAPKGGSGAPVGDALRRLYYRHDRDLPADLEGLVRRLSRRRNERDAA